MSKQYRPRKEIYVTEDKYKIITKAKGKQSFSSYVVDSAIEKANREIKS